MSKFEKYLETVSKGIYDRIKSGEFDDHLKLNEKAVYNTANYKEYAKKCDELGTQPLFSQGGYHKAKMILGQ